MLPRFVRRRRWEVWSSPVEFKREAVEYARSSDQPRYKIAESVGVSDNALADWIKAAEAAKEPGSLSADERAQLFWLRKELAGVKQERGILRQAAASFARETTR